MKKLLLSTLLAISVAFAGLAPQQVDAAAACYTYSTNGQSTLNGAINSSTTTIIVASASSFPSIAGGSGCFFHIKTDSEIIKITATSGTTFTGVRASEGTAAASHLSGATATEVVTAADLTQLKLDANISGISGNSGQSALGSDFTLNAAALTFQDTTLSIALPSAGTYLVRAKAHLTLQKNGGTFISAAMKLYNSTDAADASGYTYIYTEITSPFINSMELDKYITIAAAKTIKMYVFRNYDGSAPSSSRVDGGELLTTLTWEKKSD